MEKIKIITFTSRCINLVGRLWMYISAEHTAFATTKSSLCVNGSRSLALMASTNLSSGFVISSKNICSSFSLTTSWPKYETILSCFNTLIKETSLWMDFLISFGMDSILTIFKAQIKLPTLALYTCPYRPLPSRLRGCTWDRLKSISSNHLCEDFGSFSFSGCVVSDFILARKPNGSMLS